MTQPLSAERIEELRVSFFPLWRRKGSGLGRGECAFCGGFLVSQYGVEYPNPHAEDCGYVALCDALGFGHE